MNSVNRWKESRVLRPRRNRWPSGHGLSCGRRLQIVHRICRLQPSLTALVTRLPGGETASSNKGCPVCKTHHVRDDRPAFPRLTPVEAVSPATSQPSEHGGTAICWTLDDIVMTILNRAAHEAIGRSTVWRVLDEADLKPHKSGLLTPQSWPGLRREGPGGLSVVRRHPQALSTGTAAHLFKRKDGYADSRAQVPHSTCRARQARAA